MAKPSYWKIHVMLYHNFHLEFGGLYQILKEKEQVWQQAMKCFTKLGICNIWIVFGKSVVWIMEIFQFVRAWTFRTSWFASNLILTSISAYIWCGILHLYLPLRQVKLAHSFLPFSAAWHIKIWSNCIPIFTKK